MVNPNCLIILLMIMAAFAVNDKAEDRWYRMTNLNYRLWVGWVDSYQYSLYLGAFTQPDYLCFVSLDSTRQIVRVKAMGALLEDKATYVGNCQPPGLSPGFPYQPDCSLPLYSFSSFVANSPPKVGKSIVLLQSHRDKTASSVPLITLGNAGTDKYGRFTPVLKVVIGNARPGGVYCVLQRDASQPVYCNGELMQGFENVELLNTDYPIGYKNDNTLKATQDNSLFRIWPDHGSLFIQREDLSLYLFILPVADGWIIWDFSYLQLATQEGKALGLCSAEAGKRGGLRWIESTMRKSDGTIAKTDEELWDSYVRDDDGDNTGSSYSTSVLTTFATSEDSDEDVLDTTLSGQCAIDTASLQRHFKQKCKATKRTEKHCSLFLNSKGPLKDCLQSTRNNHTVFNPSSAYEECRLSVCAKMPRKKLCLVIKQHVDMCIVEHLNAGKDMPFSALWRSDTNCKYNKFTLKTKGRLACIRPAQQQTCWSPDSCDRLSSISTVKLPCDERVLCNSHYLWNGKKCVKDGEC